ncbi:exonuclease SbcCD subunit D [Marinitenerispora sediminis]|uniref:Nuclease SbcCD subunit D n=1 Tax=Marinitenerispora sediminis TaxID=1931232 RepID=A0A368T8U0_9ACTN|nr:exonuclease SbcCD subunit D [Marinitenerispora sediminis]RCV52651.1 exonuclease SbcCD subunit D [Marinitenerispora sediminis]RCV60348.1 exonuclease SbcCD subunit D [Marinitenerispora sediminis]RCV60601.1 exonuclease SbcCD subunit D [Marinitenerispora sediminis]
MRILHTSDWHLGRSFHRENLIGAQAAFVDHLVETVRAERVDVVAVAGDLYDRALPPIDAVRLFGEALARIRDTGARAVLVSGNHDSMVRLAYAAELIDAAGVHLRSSLDGVGQPVIVEDAHGPVAFYGIPYLEPEIVRHHWNLPDRSHATALGHAMDLVRADLATRPAGARSVVLSHAFVVGGEPSDSERDITVGGAAHVPAGVFDGVDYVALGHLHGAQRMAPGVRYSGSPLAYSFSEEHHVKGSWLVELSATGLSGAEFVPAPVPRRIARIRGRIEDLLSEPEWERYTDHWLQVTLTDPVRPGFPMDRLRERFPHALHLDFAPEGGSSDGGVSWAERVAERSEPELVLDFVDWARGTAASPAERRLIETAFEQVRQREAGR